MNKQLNKDTLIEFFENNRDILLPFCAIAVSFVILLFFILPQLLNISSTRQQYQEEETTLTVINNNLASISSVSSSKLDDDLQLASLVLPTEKNFEFILAAITHAAVTSGTSVGDFRFSIGGISGPVDEETAVTQAFPSTEVTLSVSGGVEDIVAFSNELYRTMPLSSIKQAKVQEGGSTMSVVFFYKPFNSVITNDTDPIRTLTSKDSELLSSFSDLINPANEIQNSALFTSSQSASVNFPF